MPLLTQSLKPRIILGLMTFGPKEEDGARVTDINVYGKALDVFQQRGYLEVDTAPTYVGGQQEAFTREAKWKERGLGLATKVRYPNNPGDNTPEKVVESVERSLKELGTDCVDVSIRPSPYPYWKACQLSSLTKILYLHRPDRGTPFADTLGALDKLHKAGKFVNLGLSNFAAFEVAEVVMTCKYNGWVRPTVYQGMYNCITRNIEPELFVACKRYGLDVVVYNPIAGGLFSGKIKSKDMIPESGRFSATSVQQGRNYRNRYFRESVFKAVQTVEQAAEKEGLTMIEMALRWTVHHSGLRIKDGNDGIIVGVSSVEQLEDNLTNLEKGPLPDDVVRALDEAWKISKADSVDYWHGELKYTYNVHEALFGAGTK